jgi:hypothetical protein
MSCTYGGIGVPGFEGYIGDGLAGVGVDELNIEGQGNALLAISNVLADQLARNV